MGEKQEGQVFRVRQDKGRRIEALCQRHAVAAGETQRPAERPQAEGVVVPAEGLSLGGIALVVGHDRDMGADGGEDLRVPEGERHGATAAHG